MATKPGILTEWPWKPLGSFKFVILTPWVVHSTYALVMKGERERDYGYFLIFPFLLLRMLHNQIWISISRYQTAKGKNRIVDKGLEFEQVDRERNWDDQILFNGALLYIGYMTIPQAYKLPLWRTNGVVMTILLHAGPVEFLYYWFHRALHHHYLYTRYHSHHHSSIVTEPITSVIHPFAEHIVYFMLFAIPMLTTVFTGTGSITCIIGYIMYIDFMNNMGHCNFELIPKTLFSVFPPLKYLMYTPSYHSLHHTQFRTNYSLFMPIYDYVYGTMDKSSDPLYETSLKRPEELPDVYMLQWQREAINSMIERAILDAEMKGVKGEELNSNGELYIQRYPKLELNLVDGSSLVVAVVLNNIPKGTTQVLLRGNLSKVAYAIANTLCERDIKVATLYKDEYEKLKLRLTSKSTSNLILSTSNAPKTWLVGDGWNEDEQLNAPEGTLFIPFSQFPLKKMRKDCFYHSTPAMVTPKSFTNMHSCENWLSRRVMSAWRIAGILHALEGWNVHECGDKMFNIEEIWRASLRHGFRPLAIPA
ncbi:protein ECERIFERUM 1-like [Fagus crenata]